MKKILVTGSNGFLGKALCSFLKLHKHFIIESGDKNKENLCNSEFVKTLPTCDAIIHLAATSSVSDSFLNPFEFYYNNIFSTLNLLEKARSERSSFFFLSTYVYGTPEHLPINELHVRNPLNPYTQSKVICEDLCTSYNKSFNVPVTIFRPFNIYGPGQRNSFLIPTILSQIQNDIIFLKDPKPKRDFIYVDDVINAIYLSIKKPGKQTLRIFNIGTGISLSIYTIAHIIKNISKSNAKIIFNNQKRKGEVFDTRADIKKIRSELRWAPNVSLEEGLTKTVEYYLKNNLTNSSTAKNHDK